MGCEFSKHQMMKMFIWGINPKAVSPIADRSEGPARGFILNKHKPVGQVSIRYQTKRWRGYALYILTAQSVAKALNYLTNLWISTCLTAEQCWLYQIVLWLQIIF